MDIKSMEMDELVGCCKHVAATLYQLFDYKGLNAKTVPNDKICTDILQQWRR